MLCSNVKCGNLTEEPVITPSVKCPRPSIGVDVICFPKEGVTQNRPGALRRTLLPNRTARASAACASLRIIWGRRKKTLKVHTYLCTGAHELLVGCSPE